MGKITETIINRFDGGIVNDPRDPAENTARIVSNFDIITNPRKMTPYRDSESGDSAASTSQKQNFCIALRTGTTYSLYALGVQSGTGQAEVLYKDFTTGAANDLDDDSWAATANNQSGSGSVNFNCFVYYKKTGLIYMGRAGTHIAAYDPSGSAAFSDTNQAITFSTIVQGLVHSKDDILYIAYDNKIAVNNNGSWNTTGLTLPAHYTITSLSEYGNYLAIACAPISGIGNSRLFLWDRDTSLSTVSESIDWGVGSLMILDTVDGILIGISQKGGVGTSITGNPAGTTSFGDRIIFRYLAGDQAIKFKEIIGGANSTELPIAKQKVDNRLYFMMLVEFGGSVRDGIWSIGRSPGAPLAVVHERTSNNDTALATTDTIKNFFVVGDYAFISYQAGGTFALNKTSDTATYTASSVYESKKFDAGNPSLKKDLVGVTVTTEYLPTAGQVILEYRVDQNTAWTNIFTNTTDNSISHSVNSSSGLLPKDYKEIEFRIESTGGAEITSLQFTEEITGKRLY